MLYIHIKINDMKYELIIKSKSCKEVVDVVLLKSEDEARQYISDFFDGFEMDNDFYYEIYEL